MKKIIQCLQTGNTSHQWMSCFLSCKRPWTSSVTATSPFLNLPDREASFSFSTAPWAAQHLNEHILACSSRRHLSSGLLFLELFESRCMFNDSTKTKKLISVTVRIWFHRRKLARDAQPGTIFCCKMSLRATTQPCCPTCSRVSPCFPRLFCMIFSAEIRLWPVTFPLADALLLKASRI